MRQITEAEAEYVERFTKEAKALRADVEKWMGLPTEHYDGRRSKTSVGLRWQKVMDRIDLRKRAIELQKMEANVAQIIERSMSGSEAAPIMDVLIDMHISNRALTS